MNRSLHSDGPHLISRILGAFLLVIVMAALHASQAHAQSPGPVISLMVDGIGVQSDVQPLHQNGRTLVPIRVIAEQLGASVFYEPKTRRVTFQDGTNQVAVFPDSKTGYVNGNRVMLDAAPVVKNRRTLVPLRFISESLGYEVSWDNRARVAVISSKKTAASQPVSHYRSNPYVVQPGDTLLAIAKQHGTTLEEVAENNRLSQHDLLVGQLLYLPEDAKRAKSPLAHHVDTQALLSDRYVFPFSQNSRYEAYGDSFGSSREWTESKSGTVRSHEGIDIMAPEGTAIYSVGDGVINRIGWNTYGGWRINITDDTGKYRMYYAHLQAFTPGLKVGSRVRAGQLIGFVGTTGYGSPGTEGMFPPHLHFGLYRQSDDRAINPFYYLKFWENHRVE
ncbi:peptidoglycan DD-metalloendopeptidase family protein [Brevibacillus composti]|uniref:Peptidoglycan DD-metalloendopeptidase family protein n=1 Tax=Brevibacillus composti TaxID=2796470 RepID=A0A7T5EP61_9BACL|nr:stalk domain-containing protein [Brevibacillus composti]QQE76196.1 peptidoglycan DD-metalloendopeptidase family protein [Brevibacillus composti]QUO43225.1 peptidoglycan DD-metalloendopeptidase family protein [Brevibacillus composti]